MRKRFRFLGATFALSISLAAFSPITTNAYVERQENKENNTCTYTNTDTGESFVTELYGNSATDYLKTEKKVEIISAGSYKNYLTLSTTPDVAGFANFRANKKALKIIDKADSTRELGKAYHNALKEIEKTEIDENKEVLFVDLTGEIFLVNDEFSNQNIERELGRTLSV